MRKLTQKDDIQALLVEKRLYIKNNDSYHRVSDIKYPIYGNIFKFECDDQLTYIIEDYLLNSDIGGVFVKEKYPTQIWTDGETSIYFDLDETPDAHLSKLYAAMQRDEENKIFEQITNKKNQMKQEIELKEGMTARVEGGKVIIEKKEWSPADGDFVTHKDGWIHIHKNTDARGRMKHYVAVSPDMGINVPNHDTEFIGYEREIRGKSTTAEIQKFNTLLEKAGKRWNAELKRVEDLEWKPKDGDVVTNQWDGAIFIQKSSYGSGTSFYAALYNGVFYTEGKVGYNSPRPSTHEERCTFFARLVAEGYKWNAKKLKLTKWAPKDGDFLYTPANSVVIYKSGAPAIITYCGINSFGDLNTNTGIGFGRIDGCRKATNSERQRLLDALREEGKRWNSELRRVEDVKPEYKEGDFLRTKMGGVFIYKHKDGILVMDHAFLACGGNLMMDSAPACYMTSISGYASEQEKQKLLDALSKDGKKWNATKKRIEDIKPTVVEMTMEEVCQKLGMNVKIVKK